MRHLPIVFLALCLGASSAWADDYKAAQRTLERFDYKSDPNVGRVLCKFLDDVDFEYEAADMGMAVETPKETEQEYKRVLGEQVFDSFYLIWQIWQTNVNEATPDQKAYYAVVAKIYKDACPNLNPP